MRVPLAAAIAMLLAAAGCSPGSAREGEARKGRAEATIKAAPANAAAPKRSALGAKTEGVRRCGWLSNPTPANWWLTDSEDRWILATQGAYQAPGMDEMPDMSIAGWVETNGHYGYGCACMRIAADPDGRVTRIADASPRPLKQCQRDRKLPKPG